MLQALRKASAGVHARTSLLRPITAASRAGFATAAFQRKPFTAVTGEDVTHFRALLGDAGVVTDKDDIAAYNQDWTRKWRGDCPLVLRPASTAEVSAVLRHCHARNIAVVPQGGNTGLVGGATPVFDEVVLSLSRMNKVLALDADQGIVTAEAGVVLEALTNYLEERGFTAPLDLGAKGSCQLGGNIATNAGGLRFVRYGSLRGTVLGVEAVLADGTVLDDLTALRKNNTGFDVKQLLIGSEGVLGVVTKATLLCPAKPRAVDVLYLGLSSYADVLKALALVRAELQETVSATEFQDAASMALVAKHGAAPPLAGDFPFYMLVETAGGSAEHNRAKLDAFLERAFAAFPEGAVDGVVAESDAQAKALWRLREGVPESAGREGHVFKYDVSLPVASMYALVDKTRARLEERGVMGRVRSCMGYGHLGDGNLHLNVVVDGREQQDKDAVLAALEPWLFEELASVRGSVSAEHGIGQAKPQYLHCSKSAVSIGIMRGIKTMLDPKGILNPYKVLPEPAE